MFNMIINAVAGQGKFKSVMMTGAMLAGLGMPAAAFARHHDFHVDVAIPVPEIVVPVTPCYPCPAPALVTAVTPVTRVWVPATYQTVTEKVWVPDVTTTQIQHVEIPAEFGYRDVIRIGLFGPRIHHEQYLIRPARCEDRQVAVVVTPGHFELQTHQQLVCDGHYETQAYQAPVTVVIPGN
jgi:hypothetical protein